MSGSQDPPGGRSADGTSRPAFLARPIFTPHAVNGAGQPQHRQYHRHRKPQVQPLLTSQLELGPLTSSPGTARGHIRAVLKEWGLDELADTTELVVSELTTNAVSATRALATPLPLSIRVWLHANRKRILVTVWDADPQPPVLQENVNGDAEHGRGLALVDALSSKWGWYEPPVIGGKCVYAEIPRTAAS